MWRVFWDQSLKETSSCKGRTRHFGTVHEGSAWIDETLDSLCVHAASWFIMIHRDASRSSMTLYTSLWCFIIHHDASWCHLRESRRWEWFWVAKSPPVLKNVAWCSHLHTQLIHRGIYKLLRGTERERETETETLHLGQLLRAYSSSVSSAKVFLLQLLDLKLCMQCPDWMPCVHYVQCFQCIQCRCSGLQDQITQGMNQGRAKSGRRF